MKIPAAILFWSMFLTVWILGHIWYPFWGHIVHKLYSTSITQMNHDLPITDATKRSPRYYLLPFVVSFGELESKVNFCMKLFVFFFCLPHPACYVVDFLPLNSYSSLHNLCNWDSFSYTAPRRLLVGNIHVLYNPKRGDIKLGQVTNWSFLSLLNICHVDKLYGKIIILWVETSVESTGAYILPYCCWYDKLNYVIDFMRSHDTLNSYSLYYVRFGFSGK